MRAIAALFVVSFASACATDVTTDLDDADHLDKEAAAQAVDEGKADWSYDICTARGWYGDGTCDWFCPTRDPDCDLAPLGPEPSGRATRLPIVLAHGFAGSPTNMWGFYRVTEALRADGHRVYVAQVPPFNTPAVRATYLAAVVDRAQAETGAGKVHVIAHSMGGLDTRVLASSRGLGYGDRVATVTTISTPHRGTRIADIALAGGGGTAVANAFAKLVGKTFSDVASDGDLRAALVAISVQNSASLNAAYPDDPRVRYESWAGVSKVFGTWNDADVADCEGKLLVHRGAADKMNILLAPVHAIVGGPGDGMATVRSAKHGTFRGCIPADHLDEVGQIKRDDYDRNTGFDHVRFYRNMAFELAARGG